MPNSQLPRACPTCTYCDISDRCRLNPPQVHGMDKEIWSYPLVGRGDWCHQWVESLANQSESLLDDDDDYFWDGPNREVTGGNKP